MEKITEQVLDIFQAYRMKPTPLDQYDQVGKPLLAQRLNSFILNGEVLRFVMLGFPFKSTNERDKVLGKLPDLGEELSLENFAQFNSNIKTVYNPGVEINIASDGYIFNDILNVADKTVAEYGEVSADMGRIKNAPMKWITLNDFFSGSLNEKRIKVVEQLAPTPEKLEQEILMNPDVNILYRGMTRFMMEELADKGYTSGNQLQKAAKKLTREMMIRNEAWSNLVKNEFSNYIRLSMHPSINNGSKYSFQLIKGENIHHSAWHATVGIEGVDYITIHRKDAEAKGWHLEFKDGRPYNFHA